MLVIVAPATACGPRARSTRLLERGTGADIEAVEVRDIGGERVARNADHEDRLLVGDDLCSGNDALGRDRGDDIERAAGVADRAGNLVGRERVAEDVAIGCAHDRGWRRFPAAASIVAASCRRKKLFGDPEVGACAPARHGRTSDAQNEHTPQPVSTA